MALNSSTRWFILLLILLGFVILLALVIKIFSSRITTQRRYIIESIEPPGVVKAFSFVNQLPPFKLIWYRIIREIRKHSPQGLLVDAGCGTGSLLQHLAKYFPHLRLIGIDISKEMIATAKHRFLTYKPVNQIQFHEGDIQQLPLPDNSVNFLVTSLSLHHWSNPPKAMEEIHRVLQPKGKFLIFDFRRDNIGLIYWLLRFATRFIVPKPLRQIQEPLGSMLAAYTLTEVESFFQKVDFRQFHITLWLAWMLISGQKA